MNIFVKNNVLPPNRILFCYLIIAVFVFSGCVEEKSVSLRKFPYPYLSALAVCSDIDQTGSFEEFATIQKFLNSNEKTIYGPGLGLEIGNSYWFYNDSYDKIITPEDSLLPRDEGISIFSGTTDSLNKYAPGLMRLIRAGYIDCFHSYGHFGREGFTRQLAKQAITLIQSESLAVDVYINHGASGTNFQNIGDASWCYGDNVESPYYHTDLTIPSGIKFLWRGQLTHCIGQDGRFSFLNNLKQIYEYFQDIRYTELDFEHDNRLVHVFHLDDSTKLFEFARYINPWGKYPDAIADNFSLQLGPTQVDNLINNGGYLIFYTHFGRNSGPPYLTGPTIAALQYIKKKNAEGKLMVTTTSKLLNYYVHHKYLYWHTLDTADTVNIYIDSISNPVEGNFIPDETDIQGITFYIPDNKIIGLYAGDKSIQFIQNDADKTGRHSVSVPWQFLSLPSHIFSTILTDKADILD
ncbi:MAG TPA: hypothetical protein ENL22_02185 [candidate division Zixibacteria bacterium]|nr:hypothetical protein [candidate division Zixibacteria bacterium]